MKRAILISVIMGVIAALFSAMYLTSLETKYKKGAQKVNVLVAKDYIDQGTMIAPLITEVISVPKDYLQPRALQSQKDLLNNEAKTIFMSIVPIEKGEQIMTTKLSMLGIDTGISAVIPTGKRAVTHVFDGSIISGIIKPGNKVDIIGVFEYPDKDGHMEQVSKTILQNVLVLSVGKDVIGAVKKSGIKKGEKDLVLEPLESRIPISFAITPEEANFLSIASEKGNITIALRSMGDDVIVETKETRLKDISDKIVPDIKANPQDSKIPGQYIKEMEKRQKEALEMLKKYQKK
ncbi:MAG: Flp pilus assembly protein CpaB [Elusimicrobia bacterium]|nr:Flp pilus assembly protein CpaB [Candidatus Liberimonas magnetica]